MPCRRAGVGRCGRPNRVIDRSVLSVLASTT
jgi:hypothetical protein